MSIELVLLSSIPFVPLLASIVFGLAKKGRLKSKPVVFLVYYLLTTFIIQLISSVLAFYGINNMGILGVYVIVDFMFLAFIYFLITQESITSKAFFLLASPFLAFILFDILLLTETGEFNSRALTVKSIYVVILSLSTYIFSIQQMNDAVKNENHRGLSWINSGLFTYHATAILIFYFGKTINTALPDRIGQMTWVLHSLLATIMYACFFMGLWESVKSKDVI